MSRDFVVPDLWHDRLVGTAEPSLIVEMDGCLLVEQNAAAEALRAEEGSKGGGWDSQLAPEVCVCTAWGAPEAYIPEYCPFESDYAALLGEGEVPARVSPAAFHFQHANGVRDYRLAGAESWLIAGEGAVGGLFIRLCLLERGEQELRLTDAAGEDRWVATPWGGDVRLPVAVEWSFGGAAGWESRREAVPADVEDEKLKPMLATLGALHQLKERLARGSGEIVQWAEGEGLRPHVPASLWKMLERGAPVAQIRQYVGVLTRHPADALMLQEVIYGQIVEAIVNDEAERLSPPLAKETVAARRAYRELRHLLRFGPAVGQWSAAPAAAEELSRLLGTAAAGLRLLGKKELAQFVPAEREAGVEAMRRRLAERLASAGRAGDREWVRDIVKRFDTLHRARLLEVSRPH
ncbi:MAG: hypothetical protein ACK5UT_14940 [Acidobacteriota bacterium]